MNGLEQIKSINADAARKAADKARQAKGLKPADTASAIERKARTVRPLKFHTAVTSRVASSY